MTKYVCLAPLTTHSEKSQLVLSNALLKNNTPIFLFMIPSAPVWMMLQSSFLTPVPPLIEEDEEAKVSSAVILVLRTRWFSDIFIFQLRG